MFALTKVSDPKKKKKPWKQGYTSSFRLVNKSASLSPKIRNNSPSMFQFHEVHPVSQHKKEKNPSSEEQKDNFPVSCNHFLDDMFSLTPQPYGDNIEPSFFNDRPSTNGMNNLGTYYNDFVTLTSGSMYSKTKSEFAPIYFPSCNE